MSAPDLDARRHAPATARNRRFIRDVLRDALPAAGTVLETASGSGEHAVYLAAQFPALRWAPSDREDGNLASIAAWAAEAGLPNLVPPRRIDVTGDDWGIADIAADLVAVMNANMIHIAPWSVCEGLMAGAGRLLPPGGLLYMYGPYIRDDVPTAESNLAFDASLRRRNPAWGIRDLADVAACAAANGLDLARTVEMPANNLSVLFRRH